MNKKKSGEVGSWQQFMGQNSTIARQKLHLNIYTFLGFLCVVCRPMFVAGVGGWRLRVWVCEEVYVSGRCGGCELLCLCAILV